MNALYDALVHLISDSPVYFSEYSARKIELG